MTHSKRDQTWHCLSLANRPNFSICLFYWNFHPFLFLWLLKCSKKNLRQWTWYQFKMTKIFVFQPILNYYTILEKFLFKKLIDFLWIFHRFSWFLLEKIVSPNLKVQFFYCSILIVQKMCCKKLEWISHSYFLKLYCVNSLEFFIQWDGVILKNFCSRIFKNFDIFLSQMGREDWKIWKQNSW
jgi:hypothetical protein